MQTVRAEVAPREAGKEATGRGVAGAPGQGSPKEHPCQQPDITVWKLRPKEAKGSAQVNTKKSEDPEKETPMWFKPGHVWRALQKL